MTKVLYIEHDDDNLCMLKTRLEQCCDFKVFAAEDSEKGCKMAGCVEFNAKPIEFEPLIATMRRVVVKPK